MAERRVNVNIKNFYGGTRTGMQETVKQTNLKADGEIPICDFNELL